MVTMHWIKTTWTFITDSVSNMILMHSIIENDLSAVPTVTGNIVNKWIGWFDRNKRFSNIDDIR